MTKLRIFYYLVNFEDFYVTLVPVSDVAKQDNDDNDEARKKRFIHLSATAMNLPLGVKRKCLGVEPAGATDCFCKR